MIFNNHIDNEYDTSLSTNLSALIWTKFYSCACVLGVNEDTDF